MTPRPWQSRFGFGIGLKLYGVVALAFLAVAWLAIATIQMSHRTDVAARHLYQNGLLGSRDAVQLQLLVQRHRRAIESAPSESRPERLTATSKDLARLRALIEQALAVDWSDTPEGIEEHAAFARQIKAELPAMFRHGDRVMALAANFSRSQALDVSQGPYAAAADKIQTEIQNWRDDRLRITGDEVDTLLRDARVALYWVSGSIGVAFAFGLIGLLITRGVIRRLDRITRVMVRLAGQDISVDVPSRDDRDEIGAMARAVEVFKTNAIEVRRKEAELKLTNARFTAALDNMSQGLCLYDGAERLTVVNRRFHEIFGLPEDSVRPGWTMRDVVELSVAAGNHPGRDAGELYDEYVACITRREAASFHQEIRDGRVVTISHEPAENGGWVATYADVTANRRAEQQIAFMARHDALTRLPNRATFRERIEQAIAQTDREIPAAVLFLDLDHFKAVNDTLGHPVGDRLLCTVADRLGACVRQVDTIARFGGDEFAVIQVGPERVEDVAVLARRIGDVLSAPYDVDGHRVVVGVSIGIALVPADGSDPDTLLKNADIALYRAKAEGRGVFRLFEPAMDAHLQRRRTLELDLHRALAAHEFELFYQPLVNVASGRIRGFEALMRWRHPSRGLLFPDAFVAATEEMGLIVPLGRWALREACREAATWPDDIKVAVNLSVVQFNNDLVRTVIEALAASGLPACRLNLEITESILLQNTEHVLATLNELRALGVRISMDDFGTGYSSLSYLRRFPFDKIKIDQSFIRDLAHNEDAAAIVRAVTRLATALGMATTAEGVETLDQLVRLQAEGCTEVQGFFFSEATPAADVPRLLRQFHADQELVS